MGGAVAAALAAGHPERLDRLVLIDSAGLNLALKDRPPLLRFVGALPVSLLEHIPVRRALTRVAMRQVFFDPRLVTEERFEEYLAPVLRPGAVTAISSLLRTPHADAAAFEALLRQIQAPTLILWGRDDGWIPVAQADRFASAIGRSRLTVLAGCGHLPQEERPREVAALLTSFFASPP
jgi:pimeloyl-ACP methyl ester carboxylesterase